MTARHAIWTRWSEPLQATLRFWLVMVLPVQVTWMLSDAAALPTSLLAQQLLTSLETWARLMVCLLAFWTAVHVALLDRSLTQMLPGVRNFLAGYFLLTFAVKFFADPLVEGFARDPQATSLFIGALVLLGGLARVTVPRQVLRPLNGRWAAGGRLLATHVPAQDQQVRAVRAAARVLVTAGWTASSTSGLTLTAGGGAGDAAHLQRTPGPVTRTELEQRMLWALAGQAAEAVVFGTTFHGSAADLATHARLATHFFAASPDVPGLLHGAQTPEDLAFNEGVIRALRSAQLKVLHQFFVQHRTVLDDLVQAAQQGDLSTTAIQPYLDRITVPLVVEPESGVVDGPTAFPL